MDPASTATAPAPAPAAPAAPPSLSGAYLADQLRAAFVEQAPAAPAPAEPAPAAPAEPSPDPSVPLVPSLPSVPSEEQAQVEALRTARRELQADLALAQQRAQAAEAKLAELQPSPATRNTQHETSPEVQRLAAAEAGQSELAGWARTQLRTLDRNPDKVRADLAAQNIRLADDSPEGISAWLEAVEDRASVAARDAAIQRAVAAARAEDQAQTHQQRGQAAARQFVPELSQPDSPRAKLFAQTLEAHPELARHPNGQIVAAAIVLGLEQMHAAAGTPALPAGTTPPAAPRPPATRLPGAAPRTPPTPPATPASDSQALFEKFKKSGDAKDRQAWVRSTLG